MKKEEKAKTMRAENGRK